MNDVRPIDHGMDYHGAGSLSVGMDIAFHYSILVMGVYATKLDALATNGRRVPKEFASKNTIISMVGLYRMVKTHGMEFEAMFGCHCPLSSCREMRRKVKISTGMVNK
jgi:hypothetical protein